MSVGDYLKRLVRRWRIIVATTLVLVGVTAVISLQMAPTYESSARVYVSIQDPGGDVSTALSASVYAQQQVLSYASIASSETMAQRVIEDLGLKVSPADLSGRITTVVEFGTVIFNLTAQDTSATESRAIVASVLSNYNDVIAQLNDSTAGQTAVQVSPIAQPTTPTSPVSPNIPLNVIAALFAGLFLGLAGAALRDLLDNTVKDAKDIDNLGASVLGMIPVRGRGATGEVIGASEVGSMAESFRQVRLNLQFAAIDEAPGAIVVTSCGPGEGKSFVSANLAAVYAAAGLSVVLVDADLRKPVVARRLGLDAQTGFTSVLLGRLSLEEALQPGPVSGMQVLTSGPLPPNPAEILGSDAMADLTKKLRSEFDIVIIDTPPVLPFADARALMRSVDGTVLVVDRGRTRTSDIEEALASTETTGARALGVLINRAPVSRRLSYAYDSYQVMGKSHRDSDD